MPFRPAPPDFGFQGRRRRRQRTAAFGWSLVFGAVLLGGIFASGLPHAAAPASAASPQALEQVVRQQLSALAKQDAGQAFALADPDLRTQFGTAATTMWLRLAHRVDPVTGEHEFRAGSSRDGRHWVWGGVWTFPATSDPRIGLVAQGGSTPSVTAHFDYVRFFRG